MFPTATGGSSFTRDIAERAGDGALCRRHRRRARARRSGDAVGRSRRRQDHLRARADPPPRRRRRDRGAEPDLHADAELRAAALSARSRRFLPAFGRGRTRRARLRRSARAAPSCCWNGPIAPPGFCRPTASTSPSRWRRSSTPESRNVRVVGYGAFARARRAHGAGARIPRRNPDSAKRARWRMEGDASTRIFERLTLDGRTAILMNAPRRPDGPPVRDGKPYSAIAHLAEDIVPYVAHGGGPARSQSVGAGDPACRSRARACSSWRISATSVIVAGDPPAPIEERYEAAVDLLVSLHGRKLPDTLPVAPHLEYRLPRYDMEAFLIEAELLLDWYLAGADAARRRKAGARRLSSRCGAKRSTPAVDAPPTWVLRDYHSPNLLWLPERDGVARIGVLDFQDALMGPAAYDVASLLQDARVDVPEALEVALLSRYVRARLARRPRFDAAGVRAALRDAGGAAGDQDSRHLCPARPARRQAAISASHAPPIELSAAVAGAPGAGPAQGLVRRQCAAAEMGYDGANWRMLTMAGRTS